LSASDELSVASAAAAVLKNYIYFSLEFSFGLLWYPPGSFVEPTSCAPLETDATFFLWFPCLNYFEFFEENQEVPTAPNICPSISRSDRP